MRSYMYIKVEQYQCLLKLDQFSSMTIILTKCECMILLHITADILRIDMLDDMFQVNASQYHALFYQITQHVYNVFQ